MHDLKKTYLVLLGLCLTVIFSSCGEYEALEQQKVCKKKADSLYRAHRDSLSIRFDSICASNKESYYKNALDSLTKTRIKDINNLIKK